MRFDKKKKNGQDINVIFFKNFTEGNTVKRRGCQCISLKWRGACIISANLSGGVVSFSLKNVRL